MANIRFQKPTLARKDMNAVLQTMVDEKIGPGERKREFIKSFSAYTGQKDGVALRCFTDAVSVAIRALDLEEGSKLVCSVLTPKIWETVGKGLGYSFIFTDTDIYGMPLADEVQKAVQDGAKALIFFEPLGSLPKSISDYRELGIPVIEDITESLGSEFEETKAGMLGDIVVSAFEEEGLISTGGGAICLSKKEEMIERIKALTKEGRKYIELSDLNASLGIVQLAGLGATLERRRDIFKAYQASLQKGDGKPFLTGNINYVPNGFTFPVIIESRIDEAMEFSKKYGIEVRKTFSGAIGSRFLDKYDRYPNALPALSRCLSFPLYPLMKSVEVDTISKVLRHIG